jgi:HAD superfamily hydrolase (TIGR01509 family)
VLLAILRDGASLSAAPAAMIEAILWDNDGVLVDTEERFFLATRNALARADVNLTREQYLEFSLTRGRSAFDLLEASGWSADQILRLRGERDLAYAAMLCAGCVAMDGVIETLERLKGRARMAIVTTSLRKHFDLAHRASGVREYFDLILAREDYSKSKPHPEPYLAALDRLCASAERCIAVEDSARGLQSALAAGLRCVVVPNHFTRGSHFGGALAVLDDIRALPALVDWL